MTITAEQRASIRHFFYAEHWKVGTIASELGLSHDTIKRAIATETFVSNGAHARSTLLDLGCPVRWTVARY